jgi:GT2 family glycosyltransferase
VPERTLAIVIVSYNVRADLDRCLRSLAAATLPGPTTITVVDNQSSDGTLGWLREAWPSVQAIDAGGNLGFSRANNLGIRATTSAYVLLLNPDTDVPPDALTTLVDALAADDTAAIAAPRLVDAAGRPELSFGPMIGPWAEFTQRRLGRAYDAGAPWAVARVARETARPGPRDERYFMYTDDVDLGAAVRARGRRVRFVPAATVRHLRGRSGASAPAATERRRRESQVAFYRKHHPAWAPLLVWWLKRRGVDVR